jgi:hypothetical protein
MELYEWELSFGPVQNDNASQECERSCTRLPHTSWSAFRFAARGLPLAFTATTSDCVDGVVRVIIPSGDDDRR